MSFVSQYPGTCAACGKRYRAGETIARGNGAREYVHEGCAHTLPPVTPPPTFKPSRYQQAVYDWMKDGEGHAVVEAVAGSGKTVTVVQALSYTSSRDRVAFLAFNKHIADELKRRAPAHVTVATLHSLGYAALRRACGQAGCRVDEDKVQTIMDGFAALEVPEFGHPDRPEILARRAHAAKLVSLLKATLADASSESALRGLAWRYGLDLNGDEDLIFSLVPSILARCREVTSLIDFDDMCWLPVALDLPVEQFDWVFGDEAQDWNPTQIALALRAVAPGGRCVAVGDRRQCQPAGTLVSLEGGDTKPIESVCIGDRVVSYYTQESVFRGTKTQGKRVLETCVRQYDGRLITMVAGGNATRVTPDHRCLLRMQPGTYWVMYLMRKGDRARIGITRNSHKAGSGLAMRARQEKADAAWILAAFDSKDSARLEELFAQTFFGLPSLIFNSTAQEGAMQQPFIDHFYSRLGPNFNRAIACLTHYGKSHQYPLWEKDSDNPHYGSKSFVTQACNILSGYMTVRTYDGHFRSGAWTPVITVSEQFSGPVYSLSVEPTEGGKRLYVADNIVVGNSIYGFRGADTEAIPNLISALGAITLPLSICYRCPASHVALAHEIVPQIEARPDAPEGEVLTIKEDKFAPVSGDMVICRTNAPLVGPAMALIADGKKAVIRGRDIGKSLAVLARKVFEKAATLPEALNKLERYADRERSRLVAKGAPETQLEALDDRVNTISQIAASCDSPAAVPARIEEIFSDDVAGVVFSSVHRAKGLEADTVFVLRPDLIPLRRKRQQDWEATQEHNLHYVALTRAKKTLVFVEHQTVDR